MVLVTVGRPTGTVTMLFTDVEGSTVLARELGPQWAEALSTHYAVIRGAIEESHGYVEGTEGDAVTGFFESPVDGVAAAVNAQRELARARWPEGCAGLRVRMGLHTGLVELMDDGYVGVEIHRAARVSAAAGGGQVLLTQATRALVGQEFEVEDVGEHRLKDFPHPERLFHVVIDGHGAGEFPPLRTAVALSNLPFQATSFIGRVRELEELRGLFNSSRLVTLVGSGGAGKTRLALQLAGELLDGRADGVWLVDLAPLADPDLVALTVAGVLGVRDAPGRPLVDTLTDAVGERDLLSGARQLRARHRRRRRAGCEASRLVQQGRVARDE